MEKAEIRDFTVKAIVIGVICALFGSIISGIGPEVSGSNHHHQILFSDMGYSWVQVGAFVFGSIVFLVLIIAVINQAAGKNIFSRAETTVITLIASLYILFKGCEGANSGWYTMFSQGFCIPADIYYWSSPGSVQELINLMPTIWQCHAFTADYVKAWIEKPMAPVDWGLMMPILAWWIILVIFVFLFGVFTSLILQRQWIQVESLPFPAVTFHKYLVDSVEIEESDGRKVVGFFKNKYFLSGLIICAVWWFIGYFKWLYLPGWDIEKNSMATYLVTAVGAQIPGRAPWVDGPFIYLGLIDLRRAATDAGLPYNLLYLNFNPWVIGWGFLNTTSNLIGLIIGSVIMFVLMGAVMVSMGIWPETTSTVWFMHQYYNEATWDLWPAFFLLGGMTAYLIYPLFRHRSSFIPIVKSLYTRVEPTIEKETPISYRFLWIGSIVFFIIIIAIGLLANMAPGAWIGFFLTETIIMLAWAKLIAETGGWYTILAYVETVSGLWVFNGVLWCYLGGINTGLSATNFMTYLLLGYTTFFQFVMWWWLMRSQYVTVHALKLAREEKVDCKKLLTWIISVVIVAIVISCIFDCWFSHALNQIMGSMIWYSWLGIETILAPVKSGDISGTFYGLRLPSGAFEAALGPNLSASTSYMIIGFIVVVLMMILRARFPTKFIIGPAGLLASFFIGPYVWTGWLAALIIKELVLKVGGTRLYYEKALPFFIGCTAGMFLDAFFFDWASIFANLSYITKYMMPT